MSLSVRQAGEADAVYDIFSGQVRIGRVIPVRAGGGTPTAFVWSISGILMPHPNTGSERTADDAARALINRWREWLRQAELFEGGQDPEYIALPRSQDGEEPSEP